MRRQRLTQASALCTVIGLTSLEGEGRGGGERRQRDKQKKRKAEKNANGWTKHRVREGRKKKSEASVGK